MAGLSQRIESMSESATMAITAKAKALRAAGHPVIGYGAGEPDFPTPDPIVAAAVEAAADPAMHRYTPAPGLPALREAVAAKTRRDSGYRVDAAQVIVTNGGKQAVYTGVHCLVDPGDEVLLPAPYWVTYPAVVDLAGGTTVAIDTDENSGFKVTVDQLEAAYTPRTKLLIFVSPSNPTGAVYSRAEIAAIGRWAVERGVWILTDEIYEHLVYGDATFASLPVEVPESGRAVRDRERGGQDLRHDRLAGGMDDRPRGGHQRRRQAPGPSDLQRLQRGPDRRPGRRVRPPRRRPHDAGGVRPAQPDHAPDAQRDTRHRLRGAGRRLLLLRLGHEKRSTARSETPGPQPPWNWPPPAWTRPAWPSSPARPSAHPATPASPTPSETKTSQPASPDSKTFWEHGDRRTVFTIYSIP